MYKNGLIRKLWLISKFLTSQTGQQIITIRTLPKVSRRKGNQKTKFDQLIEYYMRNTGWPTKISLIFFGDNFYKYKETSKIFSSQILEVYRILLVETTLESIMFYYTFSVINTMFVPYTALLYDSTAATRTLKLSTSFLEQNT